MKKIRIALLLAVCVTSVLAMAQMGGEGRRPQMPSVDEQVSRLSQRLNLSDDQKTQARGLLQSRLDKMNALMQDSSISREDRHSRMAEIRHSTSAQIRGLLNEDQQKKYDAMEKEREQEMQHNGHGGMGGDH